MYKKKNTATSTKRLIAAQLNLVVNLNYNLSLKNILTDWNIEKLIVQHILQDLA